MEVRTQTAVCFMPTSAVARSPVRWRCYVSQEENGFNYDQVLERGCGGLGLELTKCKLRQCDTMHILVLRVDGSY